MGYDIELPMPELIGESIQYSMPSCGRGEIVNAKLVSYMGKTDISAEILYDNGNRKQYFLSICCKNNRFSLCSDVITKENVLLLAEQKMNDYLAVLEMAKREKEEKEKQAREQQEKAERIAKEAERKAAIAAERGEAYRFLTKERGVEYLVHYTPVDNLQSIIDNGIVPREMLEKEGVPSVMPDEKRIDGRLDCTSFSISFPNYQLLYKNRQRNITFAILLIDPAVLFEIQNNAVYYLPDNAAALKDKHHYYTDISSLYNLYEDQVLTNQGLRKREELRIPEHYPSNPQAEVFVSGIIPTPYIKQIRVEDYKTYMALRKSLILPKYCDESFLYYDEKLFGRRCDWKYWTKDRPVLE